MRRKQGNGFKSLAQCCCVLGLVVLACQADPQLSEDDVSNLWSSFAKKPTPVYICSGWMGGNKLVIPEPPDCRMPPKHEINEIVSVTLYLPDVNRQTVDGVECYAIRHTNWIKRNLIDQESQGGTEEYLEVSEDACWQMWVKRKSPYGDVMNSEQNGITGTQKKLVLESYWMRNVSGSVTNYFFREVSVSVFDFDQSIITSTDILDTCRYNDTHCLTSFGILVWKANDFKTCRLTEVGPANCLFSKHENTSRLTCPDLQLSLHALSETEMCDLVFGTSQQGYYFLHNQIGQISKTISMSYDAIKVISNLHIRQKRDLWEPTNQDIFRNSKFSYLTDRLKESIDDSFQVVHNEICNTNFLLWSLVVSVAKIGYPTLLVQVLYNDPSLRASFSGDVLSVWKCEAIYEYRFIHRSACMYEWPLEYLQNGKQHRGYLVPLSHTIVNDPVPLEGICPEFFFDAKNYKLHLTKDGPKIVNLPSLPHPIVLGSKNLSLPTITFNAGSGIGPTDFADFMQHHRMMKETQTKIEVVKKQRDPTEMKFKSVTVIDVASEIGKGTVGFVWSFWSTVYEYLNYIIVFAVVVLLGAGLFSLFGPTIFFSLGLRILRFFISILTWPLRFAYNRHNMLPQHVNGERNAQEYVNRNIDGFQFGNDAPSAPLAVRQRYPQRHAGYVNFNQNYN